MKKKVNTNYAWVAKGFKTLAAAVAALVGHHWFDVLARMLAPGKLTEWVLYGFTAALIVGLAAMVLKEIGENLVRLKDGLVETWHQLKPKRRNRRGKGRGP
jgi:mannose/fructose/N-acetylgalactosamine-specific phosphotransferase system component IIC